MKTEQEVRQEIDSFLTHVEKKEKRLLTKSETKKIATLKSIAMFLSCNPNEDSLKNSLKDTENKIRIYASRYNDWCKRGELRDMTDKEKKDIYNKSTRLPTLRFQARNLKYILNRD